MAYRRGEYYRVELNPDNSSAAVWQSVTNRAVQNGTTNSVTGNLFLPKHAEAFSYDADGNMTSDGRWVYVWDGENEGQRSFNIEGTTLGFVSDPDSYYRTWPRPFTDEEAETESYLKPLTPAQELATFLSIRGACCRAATNWLWALGALQHALKLEPKSAGHQLLFAAAERDAFAAGALPKTAALQFAIRSLQIPSRPDHAELMARNAAVNAMNLAGADEGVVERELELLRVELSTLQPPRQP